MVIYATMGTCTQKGAVPLDVYLYVGEVIECELGRILQSKENEYLVLIL